MSVARLGINGFGRIGRLVCRSAFTTNASKAQVMAINDPFMDVDYLIYLLKHDSVHGKKSLLSVHEIMNTLFRTF
jgi:glyceraldehyde 3-phosphate dehydrogenase